MTGKYNPESNLKQGFEYSTYLWIQDQQKFKSLKQNYIGAIQIFQEKKKSENQAEIEEWGNKVNQFWLELTEFLAKDWGYDLDTFRELWKIKKPHIFEIELKSLMTRHTSSSTDVDFFELFANKPQNPITVKPKSLWESLVEFFSGN